MPTPHPRAHFLPFRRRDLIAFCAGEGRLGDEDAERFRMLSRMIAALYHHDFHARLDRIEDGFAPFDPDADTRTIQPVDDTEREAGWETLLQEIDDVLRQANYEAVTDEEVDEALHTRSGIVIDLQVDLAEFQAMRLYRRGLRTETIEIPRRFRRKGARATREVVILERVVLLLRYQEADWFRARGRDVDKLPFTPGRLYVQLFKDVPRADLEFLFPNVRARLTLKQKLGIVLPAVGAGIPLLIKVAASMTALFAALAIFLGLREGGNAAAMAGAVAGLTGLGALGGYLFKQYAKYKSTLTRFLKAVSEQLFFKNIDSNAGVFRTLIAAAEDEETKEAILAYYHLLLEDGLTERALDERVEAWFADALQVDVDFEVDDALGKLERLGLVARDADGGLHAKPLPEALRIVDTLWDGLYEFA
jgi:triphosphoribosyl-dephospho-CoA synthetase